jgi:preprotein translocase subunit SecE
METKNLNNEGFINKDEKPRKEVTKKAKKNNGNKKPNIFKRMGAKFKDIFSELKKVTWPTFAKVIQQTGVVIVVVLVFLVIITAFDRGLLELLNLVK